MDYSLLVGIHDCLAPISESEEEEEDYDDGGNASDGDYIDSPSSPPSGTLTVMSIYY